MSNIAQDAAQVPEEVRNQIIHEFFAAGAVERGRKGGLASAGKGGRSRSPAKQAASRENGKKGGRPRKPDSELKRPRREKKPEVNEGTKEVTNVPDI